jgi:hypothetical protein
MTRWLTVEGLQSHKWCTAAGIANRTADACGTLAARVISVALTLAAHTAVHVFAGSMLQDLPLDVQGCGSAVVNHAVADSSMIVGTTAACELYIM